MRRRLTILVAVCAVVVFALWHPVGFGSDELSGITLGPAMAWPTAPRRIYRGPRGKSKKQLIAILRDQQTVEQGYAIHAVRHLRRLKMFTSVWEYVCAMKKLTQLGAANPAIRLWQEMNARGMEPNQAAYTSVVVALDMKKRDKEALAILDEMEALDMAPFKAGILAGLRSCERTKSVERSLRWLDRLWNFPGLEPDEDVYGIVVRCCENAGDFKLADRIFKEGRSRAKLMAVDDFEEKTPDYSKYPKLPDALWRVPGSVNKSWEYSPAYLEKLVGEERAEAEEKWQERKRLGAPSSRKKLDADDRYWQKIV